MKTGLRENGKSASREKKNERDVKGAAGGELAPGEDGNKRENTIYTADKKRKEKDDLRWHDNRAMGSNLHFKAPEKLDREREREMGGGWLVARSHCGDMW